MLKNALAFLEKLQKDQPGLTYELSPNSSPPYKITLSLAGQEIPGTWYVYRDHAEMRTAYSTWKMDNVSWQSWEDDFLNYTTGKYLYAKLAQQADCYAGSPGTPLKPPFRVADTDNYQLTFKAGSFQASWYVTTSYKDGEYTIGLVLPERTPWDAQFAPLEWKVSPQELISPNMRPSVRGLWAALENRTRGYEQKQEQEKSALMLLQQKYEQLPKLTLDLIPHEEPTPATHPMLSIKFGPEDEDRLSLEFRGEHLTLSSPATFNLAEGGNSEILNIIPQLREATLSGLLRLNLATASELEPLQAGVDLV